MDWTYCSGSDGTTIARALVAETYSVESDRVELVRHRGVPEARLDGMRIELSMSRSHGYVAAACVSRDEEYSIGIDIEAVRPFLDSATKSPGIADVMLAPDELSWFRLTTGTAEVQRLYWLLRTWVRKEAVLKSLHTGFDVARGGLPPAGVVLNEPWKEAACVSHPQVAVTDLLTGKSSPVLLAVAQKAKTARRPPQ